MNLTRFPANPLLGPDASHSWEAEAAFNGGIVEISPGEYRFLYRAQSAPMLVEGKRISLSTIGCADSTDRLTFTNRRQLITPTEIWEKFGCEDPRVSRIGDIYYIFYTALSAWPPGPDSIKVAVAVTSDFLTFEKHLVTPFNAKAMALFSERIDGKLAAVLTVHTDMPPAKIAFALFPEDSDIWSPEFWAGWYSNLDHHVISVLRSLDEHVEVGAPPVLTVDGWLLVYSHIRNYFSGQKIFGIEALLLDHIKPKKIIGRTIHPLMVPEERYELAGQVPSVVFPTSVLVHNGSVGLYYGATDTSCCLATCDLSSLMLELKEQSPQAGIVNRKDRLFQKYIHNPIMQPIPEHSWEARFTLNPAAICINNTIHILYRAQGKDGISTMGYAATRDGYHIDERSPRPVYVPRIVEESAGVEDGRLTVLGDRLYMCYTAFDGKHPTRVALTSILVSDFEAGLWQWDHPQLISPPEHYDKDACLFPEMIDGKYVFLHRLQTSVWIDFVDDLSFTGSKWIQGEILFGPRENNWDSDKVGIGPPPIKTSVGWLLLYHGISKSDHKYRMGAALLDYADPRIVISRLEDAVLEPESDYQRRGIRPGTVFGSGAIVLGEDLLMYYGGADQVTCVATVRLQQLLDRLVAVKK